VHPRPFTIALTFGRTVRGEEARSYDLLEEACHEGEQDTQQLLRQLVGKP